MAGTVTMASGYDAHYPTGGRWKKDAEGNRQADRQAGPGGYYIGGAQAGEPDGLWFGKGAEALGLQPGQVVDKDPYFRVMDQLDPRDGVTKLGRPRGDYKFERQLAKLKAAEPHATGERIVELERQAAQATRRSPVYTDATMSFSKSFGIFHASLREIARQARLAGDEAAAAYWDRQEARYQEIKQEANRAGLEYMQQVAVTRTGHHGARVDGQEPGRYEETGLVISSWLQGTSRDGDPQDHIHNVIARMSRTASDGKWRAVDTMTLRGHIGAMRGIVTAHLDAAMTREFGVQMVPREDGQGNEIAGITREQIERYSSRTQTINGATKAAVDAWADKHGREPSRRELLYIRQQVTMDTRQGKEEGQIDWDAMLEKWAVQWDARDGSSLAQVACAVSNLRGPEGGADAGGQREPEPGGPAPTLDAQPRAMQNGARAGAGRALDVDPRGSDARDGRLHAARGAPDGTGRRRRPAARHDGPGYRRARPSRWSASTLRSGRRPRSICGGSWTAAASTPGRGHPGTPRRCSCPVRSSWWPPPAGRRPRI